MSRYTITKADGSGAKYSGTPTYHGTYLQPGYLEFTNVPKSSVISWEIGDKVVYDRTGRTYRLFDIPAVEKSASVGSVGNALVYQSVKLYDDTKWMERAPFRDLVGSGSNYYFSSQSGVHTMNEMVSGIADRLTRNMNDFVGADAWLFVVPDDLDEKYEADVAKDFSVDGSVLDALDTIYNTWNNLGWWYKYENGKNVITFGEDPTEALPETLSYGNGLLSLKRTQTDLDNYATRLYVYGSDKNMPNRFYNKQNIYQKNNVYIPNLMLPIGKWGKTSGLPDASKAYFDNGGAAKHYRTIRFDGSDNEEIYPSITKSTIGYLRDALSEDDKYYPADTWNDADRLDQIYQVVSMPTDSGHDSLDESKTDNYTCAEYMTISSDSWFDFWSKSFVLSTFDTSSSYGDQLLCTFPIPEYALKVVLHDINDIEFVRTCLVATLELKRDGNLVYSQPLSFEDGPVYATQVQINAAFPQIFITHSSGVYTLSVKFEFQAGRSYPTRHITASFNTDIKWTLKDSKISYFDLRFRQLGFDPNACVGSCIMSMKSGACAGREFNMKSIRYESATDTWIARFARYQDTSLNTYYPNSDLQIKANDEFVFLGIEMPDIYVHLQAQRMYELASATWEQVSAPAYTYEPQIDSKFIFNLGQYPLEGRMMSFSDSHIASAMSSILQSVTINEDGDIPRISLTLSDVRAQSALRVVNRSVTRLTTIVTQTSKEVENAQRAASRDGGTNTTTDADVSSIDRRVTVIENNLDIMSLDILDESGAYLRGDVVRRDVGGTWRGYRFKEDCIAGAFNANKLQSLSLKTLAMPLQLEMVNIIKICK